jgi:hypothetical protein
MQKEIYFMTKKCTKTISLDGSEQMVKIGIAATPEEKKEIYRLRYRTYAEEMSYPLTYADHKNKLLYDELDAWGILLYAKVDSEIVGTMMINIGLASEFPEDLAYHLCLDRFKKFYNGTNDFKVAYISKGIIDPSYRNTPVFNLLSEKSYEIYCEHQVQFSFGICNFYLLPLHEHFGYRRFGRISIDQSYGTIAQIVLLPDDIEHLRAVGSLFYNMAKKRQNLNRFTANWFHTEFPETRTTINSQLITQEQLWDIMCKRLGKAPHKAIHMLSGLSEMEAQKVLHRCSVIVQCYENDYITICESISNEVNILLSGRVNSLTALEQESDKILPGQHFGAIGLVNRDKHPSNIIAATAAEILILSRHLFRKFSSSHPETTNKILQNLDNYNM